MQVKCISKVLQNAAILLTFIKLPFVIEIFVLSFFEWPFYTGLTVLRIVYNRLKSSSNFYFKVKQWPNLERETPSYDMLAVTK